MLKPLGLERINTILFFLILISLILYFGRELLVIITFSGFLAMLITPVSNKLEDLKLSRILTSIISVLLIVAVITSVIMLLSAQIANISDEIPQIKSRVDEMIGSLQSWVKNRFGISIEQQAITVKDQASGAISSAGGFLAGMVTGTFTFIGTFALVLVFAFLFLLNREKYENFVIMLFGENKRPEAKEMLSKISKVAQQYLGGRLISIFLLAILYMIGFTIVGLKNAALLAAITAVMSFIPYVGPFIGGLLPFFMAMVDGSANQALWVVIIVSLAQVFDNYFIEPYVVGGSVSISPFFSIFILILGGVFWGIAGVILFLPLLGITKIIFEEVEGLQPYAYLIGDQKESSGPKEIWSKFKGLFSKGQKKK
jgi:predicted PurR-regulated permease PerM